MVNVHYIVVILKPLDKQTHELAVVLAVKVNGGLRYFFFVGGLYLISRRLDGIGDIVNVVRLR